MPKPKPVASFGDIMADTLKDNRLWTKSHGTYIAGRAYVDEADHTASQMETKWGADRLRLLVTPDLREKFDRQRYKFNHAIWHGELEDVRREANRMVVAWLALDKAATAAGKSKLDPKVMELTVDGRVVAIVPDAGHAGLVQADGRKLSIYTLDEIGRLLAMAPGVIAAKLTFPGAEVVAVRRTIDDPLNAIPETRGNIDDSFDGTVLDEAAE